MLPTFQGSLSLFLQSSKRLGKVNMSFQTLSERLTALQESNAQLKELIERLATIKFQPGSIPLENEEGNVMTELTSEIHQTLKDQNEDFELLQEDVHGLDSGRHGSDLELQKDRLDLAVKRAIKELKV
jgi:protein transport protein SEC20